MLRSTKECYGLLRNTKTIIKEYRILTLIPAVTQSGHRSGYCETAIARRTEKYTAEATTNEVLEDDTNGRK